MVFVGRSEGLGCFLPSSKSSPVVVGVFCVTRSGFLDILVSLALEIFSI